MVFVRFSVGKEQIWRPDCLPDTPWLCACTRTAKKFEIWGQRNFGDRSHQDHCLDFTVWVYTFLHWVFTKRAKALMLVFIL